MVLESRSSQNFESPSNRIVDCHGTVSLRLRKIAPCTGQFAQNYAFLAMENAPPEDPSMEELLELMRSDDETERLDGAALLAEIVGSAFDADGAAIGESLRALGGVEALCGILEEPNEAMQEQALLILANLCSNSVDPNATLTKRELWRCGGGRLLTVCIFSEDETVLMLAAGCLQNLCDVAEWCQYVVGMGVKERLEALLEHDDPMLVRYAVSRATALPPAAALRGRV